MKPSTVTSESTAYEFTEWLHRNPSVDGFQGWDVIRAESGKVLHLMSGTRRVTFDVSFVWEWRKAINDWIRSRA